MSELEESAARYTLHRGDCLEVMRGMAADSVDCVVADIPYFEIVNEGWDKQWATIEDYQAWVDSWAGELRRIVKHNGSIYIFGDDKVSAYVQVVLDRRFLLLNNLVWFKTTNQAMRGVYGFRSWVPMTERILFYTPQYDSTGWQTVKLDVNNFQPLRDYFREYQQAIGRGKNDIVAEIGQRADHCFRWGSTQWDLPTAETYAELGQRFHTNGFKRREYEDLRREYEDLRREYEDLRREYEDLRRTWNTDGNTLDVIIGNIVTAKENTPHPTTKPIWLMERLITVSTNAGDTVLDFTMGSGTTGVAAMRTGRRFVGIELDATYFAIAEERIRNAAGEIVVTQKEKAAGKVSLFDWAGGASV